MNTVRNPLSEKPENAVCLLNLQSIIIFYSILVTVQKCIVFKLMLQNEFPLFCVICYELLTNTLHAKQKRSASLCFYIVLSLLRRLFYLWSTICLVYRVLCRPLSPTVRSLPMVIATIINPTSCPLSDLENICEDFRPHLL